RRVFQEQLGLAAELALPVVVHTRAAGEETADLLAMFTGTVVMHCFSSPELLPAVLERGYYVSFAGNITFPKAEELRQAAARVPAKRELGQHFLVDENILGVIGRLADLRPDDVVLEIGPGFGVLTGYLADRVARVVAVEIDRSLEHKLAERLAGRQNVELLFG